MTSQTSQDEFWGRSPTTLRRETRELSGLIEATGAVAHGVWRDILISVWRQSPSYAEAERQCDTLARLVEASDTPGLCLVTEASCEIPPVGVRRLLAARLRRLKPLKVFAVCVQAEQESEAALMRAAIRMLAVAGGTKAAYFGADVPTVAEYLSGLYPTLGGVWGERAVRILTQASELAVAANSTREHRIPPAFGFESDG